MGKTKNIPKSSKKEGIKFIISTVIPIVISIAALVISISTYQSNQESKPLAYYIKPTITNFTDSTISVELEVMVTNGAVGDVRIIDYKDGKITDIANNEGGTIKKTSSKAERTFEFEILYEKQPNEFIMTEYILVNGKDGSKNLGMILYHVNLYSKEITAKYYSVQDLIFAEMDSSQEVYAVALNNYQELVNILKEKGVL